MSEMRWNEIFPEEFWADSDIHISKLSDNCFKEKRSYLRGQLQVQVGIAKWNGYTRRQFLSVLDKRADYSLPLPEILSLANLEYTDLFAIFSKMHSRTFVLSLRLCKDVHKLLCKTFTKFNIRLQHVNLWPIEDAIFYGRGLGGAGSQIEDPTSILPFTFSDGDIVWDGKCHWNLFSQMKWPFTKVFFKIKRRSPKLEVKPWMVGSTLEVCGSLPMSETLEEITKKMKPKKIIEDMWGIGSTEDQDKLLCRAEHFLSADFHDEELVAKFVQKWRSGDWNYKAEAIDGYHYGPAHRMVGVIDGGRTFKYFGNRNTINVLVVSPDHRFLLLIMVVSLDPTPHRIYIRSNIRSFNDLVNKLPATLATRPIDFSGYNGDPDALLNVQAYFDLLKAYDSRRFVDTSVQDRPSEPRHVPAPMKKKPVQRRNPARKGNHVRRYSHFHK